MVTDISKERMELSRSLDRLFEESGKSRQAWADALGVTRGAMWQWSDGRTVPRAEVWLKVLEHASQTEVLDEAVADLLVALNVPLGKLGVKQPSRREGTLLDEIVARVSKDLVGRLAGLSFPDALGVLDGAMRQARRRERDGSWEDDLFEQFDHVVGPVLDTALDADDSTVDRARVGAAVWKATYEWALACPDEPITEGQVTRVVNDAVRGLVVEWGGALQSPSY